MAIPLKLKFIGAVGTVTGSKTLLQFGKHKYLIDCGLFQGPKTIREKNWVEHPELQDVDGIVLTHAHVDHSGFLPRVYKLGYRGPVYSTFATYELCKILLPDTGYLQAEDARYANDAKFSSHSPALPLFDEKDAINSLKLFHPVSFHEWHPLCPGLSYRFLRAGHILGSAILQFSFANDNGSKILTFTGDLGNGRSFILNEPETVSETDYLVCESTYGDRLQDRDENPLERLAGVINKVCERGGTLIIPAFAVGRTQEILYLLSELERTNRIKKWPVYLDSPMAQNATDAYKKFAEEVRDDLRCNQLIDRLQCARFSEIKSADDSMLLCMSTQPKIVISAAGMLTGGRVLHHLKAKLPDEKSGVLFVGYQATGTKGLLLKQGFKEIRIHHQKISVEAEIFTMESLSAHADADDLLKWVAKMSKKPKRVYLNHGEPNSAETLKYLFQSELELETVIPQENEVHTLT